MYLISTKESLFMIGQLLKLKLFTKLNYPTKQISEALSAVKSKYLAAYLNLLWMQS